MGRMEGGRKGGREGGRDGKGEGEEEECKCLPYIKQIHNMYSIHVCIRHAALHFK